MKEYIVPLSEDEAFYGFKDVAKELIRCKDCKYRDEFCRCNLFMNFHPHVLDNGYCSDAKGKEE